MCSKIPVFATEYKPSFPIDDSSYLSVVDEPEPYHPVALASARPLPDGDDSQEPTTTDAMQRTSLYLQILNTAGVETSDL